MFRCEKCNKLSEPGEPAIRVTVETRKKEYPRREFAIKVKDRWIEDPGGVGIEIVREELRHVDCSGYRK